MIYKIERLIKRFQEERHVVVVKWYQIAPRIIECVTETADFWQKREVHQLKLDF